MGIKVIISNDTEHLSIFPYFLKYSSLSSLPARKAIYFDDLLRKIMKRKMSDTIRIMADTMARKPEYNNTHPYANIIAVANNEDFFWGVSDSRQYRIWYLYDKEAIIYIIIADAIAPIVRTPE